ncbi:hypothetical protein [Frigoribacterium sp. Leaf8]|uniref:hypothetical protein n=1 Tax=Frigoribacterium sp. Leaf8 TaxID=1735673 RepID=UPI0012FBF92D|nr:hypothetical protein [Frigoribacterium sp. Leaf8]
MMDVDGLRAEVEAAGFGHLGFLIGNTSLPVSGAHVIGQIDGVWVTFLRDERGLVEELTLVEHPDERSAVTEFMSQLRNLARLDELRAVLEAESLLRLDHVIDGDYTRGSTASSRRSMTDDDSNTLASLPNRVNQLGLGHLNFLIGDGETQRPYALVIAQGEGGWSTFVRDERGLTRVKSVRTYPDERSAVEGFLVLLDGIALVKRLRSEAAAEKDV